MTADGAETSSDQDPVSEGSIGQARRLVADLLADVAGDASQVRDKLLKVERHLRNLADREAAIDALHRTAADIISTHQVDDVFDAAVQRTQRLIGSDLAYLSLFDETTRETVVKTSVGAFDVSFNQLRVPYGSGVGGVVALSKEPFFTSDYLSDARLSHLSRVDQGIGAEGIRAMLGVPLIVDDRFTGALFVADRRVRDYTLEEVEHLSALGSLVALAIDGARLLEQREQALRDLKGAYDALRTRNAIIERVATLHDRMGEIVARGGTPGELAALLSDALAVTVTLDRTALPPGKGTDPATLALAASMKNGGCREIEVGGGGDEEQWVLSLSNGPDVFGAFAIRTNRPLLGTDRRTLERGGHVATLLLTAERDRQIEAEAGRAKLLGSILTPHQDDGLLARQAAALGFELGRAGTICAIDAGVSATPQMLAAVHRSLRDTGALACLHADRLFALLPDPMSHEAFHGALAESLGRTPTVGLDRCADWVRRGREAGEAARRCCELLVQLGRLGTMASSAQFGALSLLLKGNSRHDLLGFVRDTLGSVLRYDAEHRTTLVPTLVAYFDTGRNATAAASRLGIHHKTMVQRLDRLAQLLGASWLDAERSLQVQFALHLTVLIGPVHDFGPEIPPMAGITASEFTEDQGSAQAIRGR